jgi:hypothetical protein
MKKTIIFYSVAVVILLALFALIDLNGADYLVISSFIFIFMQSIVGIAQDKTSYSLNQFYWLFNMLFFAIAPFIQYSVKVYPWIVTISSTDLLSTNVYIILINLCYSVVRLFQRGTYKKTFITNISRRKRFIDWNIDFSKRYFKRTFIVFLCCVAVLIAVTGFSNLFLRANSWGNASELEINSSFRLVIDKFMRGAILFYLLLSILYFRIWNSKISLFWLISILVIAIITNFPTGIPRYMAGSFYIGVLLNWKRVFKYNYIPIVIAFFALCFLFPAFAATRNSEFDISKSANFVLNPAVDGYTSGNFDSYVMVSESIKYIDNHSITWGNQLFGSLFFFIPRSIWVNKPTGSGDTIAKAHNYVFANVGCPYIAEGIINWGRLGGFLFIAALSCLIYRYDFFYWNMIKNNFVNNFWVLMYPVSMGFLVFILRGDLLSSLSYYIGIIVGGMAIFYINKPRKVKY